MNLKFRWFFGFFLSSILLYYGGEGDYARVIVAFFVLISLICLAFYIPRKTSFINYNWIIFLFITPIIIGVLQILPLNFHSAWTNDDLIILKESSGSTTLSINPAKSYDCLTWTITLCGLFLVLSILFRGDRIYSLSNGITIVSGFHALLGIILLLYGADWPSEASTFSRSSFIYPNHAAAFWAACLPLSLLTAKYHRDWWRWLICIFLGLGILLSGSRGGVIVATIFILPLVPMLLPRRRRFLWGLSLFTIIVAWLTIINLHELGHRFELLRGKDGLTLDGRINIWKAAVPIMFDSGPLGCGSGTTTMAFRRSGDSTFGNLIVDHLHSDPLEWWLEYGWIGASCGIIGLLFSLWMLRPKKLSGYESSKQMGHFIGAFLGVIILLSYSCGDFILHNPILDILIGALMVIMSYTGKSNGSTEPHSSLFFRLAALIASFAICTLIFKSFLHERDNLLARNAGKFAYSRISNHLSIDNIGPIKNALSVIPTTVELATIQSWLYRLQPISDNEHQSNLRRVEEALNLAASLSPGDASAWTERAAYFAEMKMPVEAANAAHRALTWAPAWPDVQLSILNIARSGSIFPEKDMRLIIEDILEHGISQPDWFFPISSNYIGSLELSRRLTKAGIRLLASGMSWLEENGQLSDWLFIKRKLRDDKNVLSPELYILGEILYGNKSFTISIPASREDRRNASEYLSYCDLPIPENLNLVLSKDKDPWSQWSKPIDIFDSARRINLENVLRGELYHEWAKSWFNRLSLVDRVMNGDLTSLDRNSDPLLLNKLICGIPTLQISSSEKQRCLALLSRYSTVEWQKLTSHLQFSWLYVSKNGTTKAKVSNLTWVGIVIDGKWYGWSRGEIDLSPLVSIGLHRLVLLNL